MEDGIVDRSGVANSDAFKIVFIKHLKTVTLDRSNYFAWRTQFVVILRGHELLDLIQGWLIICIISLISSDSSSRDEFSISKSVKLSDYERRPFNRGAARIKKPNPRYALSISASEISVPSSVKQALENEGWKSAMKKEYDALVNNGTWELVPRMPTDNVINFIWLFKVKEKSDGSVDRLKARLVANGSNHIEGRDYNETFSPVVKSVSICAVLTIAVSRGWKLNQIDIGNAFLHGQLEERILMRQPKGFMDESCPNHVCLLKKAIYGLKQSSRMWFRRLKMVLNLMGFIPSQSDPSLFVHLGATHLAANPVYHSKIKHAAMDFRFVRERMEDKTLVVQHIPNTLQQADILTKALKPKLFKDLKDKLICSHHQT